MNNFLKFIEQERGGAYRALSFILIAALLVWALGLPSWFKFAEGANLTFVKDTLSDSDLSAAANHTIEFVTQSEITASSTIVVDFADQFQSTSSPAFDITDPLDYDIASSTTDLTIYAAGGCTGGATAEAEFEITSITTANVFTLTHCDGSAALAAGATTTVKFGTNATVGGTGDSQLVNPGVAQSYVISVTAPSGDTADTRVAIIDDVVVTASVDTTLTFTISGVASGQTPANGEAGTTDVTTTSTAIPWGTLSPGTAKTARQDLAVTTNARNGFTVTIFQDQNLTSSTGADIDNFADDNGQSTPIAWASPTGTLDQENTYGHMGLTSADDINSDEFGAALYAAIGTSTPREIFHHTGPADGSTANKGATEIGLKIEIDALQEAGQDYTNTLTYIATPTF